MNPLIIEGSTETPEIILDKKTNTFVFKGKSLPENPIYFYKPVIKWLRKKEPLLYSEAAHVVTLTYKSVDIVVKRFKVDKEKISVIPCSTGITAEEYDKEKLKKELGLEGRYPVFVYSGSVGTWYMIDEMLEFFGKITEKYPDAALLFLSPSKTDYLKDKYDFLNNGNFKSYYFPHNEVKKYLQAADIGIFFIKPLPSKQASSPTKMGEMLSVGLPVITNDIGDNKMILSKYGAGIILDDFSQYAYKNAMDGINGLLNANKLDIKKTAEEFFSVETAVKKYSSIYEKM